MLMCTLCHIPYVYCFGYVERCQYRCFQSNRRGIPRSLGISADCSYVIAACICIGEMALGYVALIRMLFIRFHWVYPMVMSVFAYITYTNLTDTYGGIESCGCFGEFIHLNPAHSFIRISLFYWHVLV